MPFYSTKRISDNGSLHLLDWLQCWPATLNSWSISISPPVFQFLLAWSIDVSAMVDAERKGESFMEVPE